MGIAWTAAQQGWTTGAADCRATGEVPLSPRDPSHSLKLELVLQGIWQRGKLQLSGRGTLQG